MTNIFEAYKDLNPRELHTIRVMFFDEFKTSETALQNFLKGKTKPKNKFVKFFSILFDIKENLSPIVMMESLSREYFVFEYNKEILISHTIPKSPINHKAVSVNTVTQVKLSPSQQARANQRVANAIRMEEKKRREEYDTKFR